jgi:alginate O-acetyltransferase complex protein AlgI
MVFSSLVFLFAFLPVTLLVYYAVPNRHRNFVALAASAFFYAWGAPRFIFVLVASCAFDYVLSHRLHETDPALKRRRHGLLATAVTINLSVLFYFKYANFFVAQVNQLLATLGGRPMAWLEVALPIGISFFTFQKISYLVDVYRGTARPAKSFGTYVLYVVLFPQLIAGPIVRYHDVAAQLESRDHTAEKFLSGIWRFCLGLGKKVLIANILGEVADRAFDTAVAELPASYAWVGVSCYAFQIYFDFSGYSDMAIGLGRMLGIEFLENFNRPYLARNFTEFWRRWHISLSNFMREYLYLPLGGNRVGRFRTYLNLWIVFVCSGFWHGAAWNFVVWGAYHGFFLSLDKMLKGTRWGRMPGVIAVPLNFLLVLFSWVLFRSKDLGCAMQYLRRMLDFTANRVTPEYPWNEMMGAPAWAVLAAAVVITFAPAFLHSAGPAPATGEKRVAVRVLQYAVSLVLLVFSAAALATSKFNPFIYFRF